MTSQYLLFTPYIYIEHTSIFSTTQECWIIFIKTQFMSTSSVLHQFLCVTTHSSGGYVGKTHLGVAKRAFIKSFVLEYAPAALQGAGKYCSIAIRIYKRPYMEV